MPPNLPPADQWHRDARIVVVENGCALKEAISDLLVRCGYRNISCFDDELKAIATFAVDRPDLIVLGLRDSVHYGLALLEEVKRAAGSESYVPILVISQGNDPQIRLRTFLLGAEAWLPKPFENLEALTQVTNLLQTRRAFRKLEEKIAELRRHLEQRAAETDRVHLELVERLARAGEYRDDDTGGHTRRVGELCRRIALHVGYSREQAEIIGRAAQLHDLGKIAIPDGILHKPGPLTTDERELMKTHASAGADVLRGGSSDIVVIAEHIAHCHHEHWDGSGYPRGLKGNAIPMAARITAVADFYDALTSDRPYRSGLPQGDVVAMIRDLASSHFDPVVVNAFLAVVEGEDYEPVPVRSEAA